MGVLGVGQHRTERRCVRQGCRRLRPPRALPRPLRGTERALVPAYALLYDTIGLPNLPASPPAVAGYIDNLSLPPPMPNASALFAKYPSAAHVTITAIPGSSVGYTAKVIDCEQGDYTPLQAVQQAAHYGQTIYGSAGNQLSQPGINRWLANWDLTEAEAAGLLGTQLAGGTIVAVQYGHDISDGAGSTYDVSVAEPAWLGIKAPAAASTPTSDPTPTVSSIQERLDVFLLHNADYGYAAFTANGKQTGVSVAFADLAKAAGVPVLENVATSDWNNIARFYSES